MQGNAFVTATTYNLVMKKADPIIKRIEFAGMEFTENMPMIRYHQWFAESGTDPSENWKFWT